MVYHDDEISAARWISLIAPPVIIFVGVGGNIATISTILTSKKLTSRVLSVVLLFLSFADLLTLMSGYFAKWLVNVTSFDLEIIAEIAYRNTSDHGVYYKAEVIIKSVHYVYYVCSTLSSTTVAVLSIERLIASAWPLKASIWLTHKRTTCILLTLLVLILILYSPLLFMEHLLYYNPETGVDDFLGDFPLWTSMIGICVIPFTIILPANITSILVLRSMMIHKKLLNQLSFIITYHICKSNFAINIFFYFFVSSEFREEFYNMCKRIFKCSKKEEN